MQVIAWISDSGDGVCIGGAKALAMHTKPK